MTVEKDCIILSIFSSKKVETSSEEMEEGAGEAGGLRSDENVAKSLKGLNADSSSLAMKREDLAADISVVKVDRREQYEKRSGAISSIFSSPQLLQSMLDSRDEVWELRGILEDNE